MDNYSLSGFAHPPINQKGKKGGGWEKKKATPQPASASSKPSQTLQL